jgi:P27 family predicted phage terminase small subunit
MGERGPLPKTRRQRKLTGNASNRKLPPPAKAESILPTDDLGDCPKWMGKEGKAYWKRIVPVLSQRMQLSSLDWPTMVQMCQAWDDFQESAKEIQKLGRTTKTTKGNTVIHPAYKQMEKASTRFAKFAEMFQLTPKSRRRWEANNGFQPATEQPEQADELGSYLGEK